MLRPLTKAAGLGLLIALATAGSAVAAVAVSTANVRSGPGTGYNIVDSLYPGERVRIVDHIGSWCAVEKPGPNGFVACYLLSDDRGPGPRPYAPYRYNPYRYDPYRDYGPSFSFSFGVGGDPHGHEHDHDHMHMHP